MSKTILDGQSKLLLKPQEADHGKGITAAPSKVDDENRSTQID